jgi:hypothetical protein
VDGEEVVDFQGGELEAGFVEDFEDVVRCFNLASCLLMAFREIWGLSNRLHSSSHLNILY